MKNSGMSWVTRASMIVLLTVLTSLFMLDGLLAPMQADAAPVRIRTTTGSGSAASYALTPLAAAPANGNTLVAVITTRSATDAVSSLGQTGAVWSRVAAGQNAGGTTTTSIWYAPNVQSAGTAIQLNLSSAVVSAVVVAEYSGILTAGAVNTTANATGNGTAASTGTTAATTRASELFVGGVGLVVNTYTLGTITNSFTSVANVQSGTTARVYYLDRIASLTAATSSGGTVSTSSQWSGVIAAFRAPVSTCASCHLNPPTDGIRSGTTGQFPGSHTIHTQAAGYAYACSVCHRDPGTTNFSHSNGMINMLPAIDGVAGSRYRNLTSFPVTNAAPVFGTCNTSKCHGTNSAAWGSSASTTQCTECHGQANFAYANTSAAQIAPTGVTSAVDTAGLTTGNRVGTHQAHMAGTTGMSRKVKCGDCHAPVNATTASIKAHLNMTSATTTFSALANGSKAAVVRTGTVSRAANGQITCTNTYCHKGYTAIGGTATAPAFNNAALLNTTMDVASCNVCHGLPPLTSGSHGAVATITAFNTTQLGTCTGCHTTLNVNGTTYATIFNTADITKHIDGKLDGGHAYPFGGSVHRPGGTGSPLADAPAPYTNCNGCHTNISTGGGYPVTRGNAVLITCGNCHINYTNFSGATPGCWDCHGSSATDGMPNGASFPNLAGSHAKHVTGQNMGCPDCHNGGGTGTVNHGSAGGVMTSLGRVNVASPTAAFTFSWAGGTGKGTCSSVACHGTAEWGVTTFNCVTCHNGAITITKGPLAGGQRRNVSVEFMSTWSHVRSMKAAAGGTITTVGTIPPAACVLCHMEGNPATGSSMGSYHGNGYVELRDPDTGVTIQNVAWVSVGGTAGNGWYTSTGTPMNTMAAFRRNLASATLEPQVTATQINFCIKCHDADGAMSTLARIGTTNRATVPALRPFNVTVKDWTSNTAMSSVGNLSNGSGNVVDVKSSFMTSNASYHPVMGKADNAYSSKLRMAAPWNSTNKTIGTVGQWGALMSCWDCHAGQAAGGMLTFSVTAHGAPATLRGPIRGGTLGTLATNNFCVVCHLGYGGPGNHAATAFGTSAFTGGGNSAMSGSMKSCHYCHGSGIGLGSVAVNGSATLTEALVRPLRGEDVHGFNNRLPQVNGSRWASGNRPYAFIRNTLTSWRPARSPETATTTSGSCAGISGRTCDNNMGGDTYSPGGAY